MSLVNANVAGPINAALAERPVGSGLSIGVGRNTTINQGIG